VPLDGMWIATERKGQSGKVLAPEECVTRYQALKMVTSDAAHILGLDHLVGSIEAGKLADFTVLDQDPLEAEADLRRISVWGTVVGGEKFPREHNWSVKGLAELPNHYIQGILALKVRWTKGCPRRMWRFGLYCAQRCAKRAEQPKAPVQLEETNDMRERLN